MTLADRPALTRRPALNRRLMAEWLGSFSPLATVVGSGIMAQRLSGGNVAALATWFFHWLLREGK